jgi:23S rRNA maturation-related 3'-5' exoribonuclease YhaM
MNEIGKLKEEVKQYIFHTENPVLTDLKSHLSSKAYSDDFLSQNLFICLYLIFYYYFNSI